MVARVLRVEHLEIVDPLMAAQLLPVEAAAMSLLVPVAQVVMLLEVRVLLVVTLSLIVEAEVKVPTASKQVDKI